MRKIRPYGNDGLIGPHLLSRAALNYLLAGQFRTILWNNVPGDWKDPHGWVDTCLSRLSDHDWSVLVLHDIESGCLERLPELVARLKDRGVSFEQDFPKSRP